MARTRGALPARSVAAEAGMVDLGAWFNARLDEEFYTRQKFQVLGGLAPGVREIEGFRFELRGALRLCSRPAEDGAHRRFPAAVEGIVLHRPVRRLVFLHGCAWDAQEGVEIGHWTLRMAEGHRAVLPLVYGRSVLTAWPPAEEPESLWAAFRDAGGRLVTVAANTLANPDAGTPTPARLCVTVWNNPRPGTTVERLDLVTDRRRFSTPFLLAINLE